MTKNAVERTVEGLFDGLFSRAFKSSIKPLQIGRRLLRTVDEERRVDAQGRRVVPNSYLVHLSPRDREGFADLEPSLHQELTVALREYVKAEGYHVEGKARVSFHTNPDLKRGRFEIEARNLDQGTKTETAPGATEAPAAPPVLTVVHDAFDRPPAVITLPGGQRVEIREGHYVLGRNLECDIVVNDSNVSRRHAEFTCAAGEVSVRDLGSTNGTRVNGVVVMGEQLLQHGDVVGLGSVQVTFEVS